ncbi:hypothetical protein WJU16_02930 [Chitinophaga pollutisoli]|uniref:PRTRC system protein B n=1 Tax=Chitinophaga pollutisoli TaxID=3133966 RepID=A0ABZ2YT24_9BACT
MDNLLTMLDITYDPVKVYVLMQPNTSHVAPYVEAYRVHNRRMTAAHPLSLDEGQQLAEMLSGAASVAFGCFQPQGIIPANVLRTVTGRAGYAIWHTPAQKMQLLFDECLYIPEGISAIPPLLWKATRTHLEIFALSSDHRPDLNTPLLRAPFYNTSSEGRVCMGNVRIGTDNIPCLEDFISLWEQAFFKSTFTHLGELTNGPIKGDLNALWRELIGTGKTFPVRELKKSYITLKSLL